LTVPHHAILHGYYAALDHAKPGAATGPPAAVFTPDRSPGRIDCQAMGRAVDPAEPE
jgi:hypothetical protein